MGESSAPAPSVEVIDLHAHVVLAATEGLAGIYGPEVGADENGQPWYRIGNYVLRGVRYRGSPFMDVARRLEGMDRAGITLQMLSPNPLTYFHRIGADDAAHYCARHNEALAELTREHPGRLLGAAALPMQDLDAALEELERSVRELGLRAAYVGTDFGRDLDHPDLDDFYRTLVRLDVPVFFHPSPTGGIEPPDDVRLRRFDLDLLVGFAYEETIAVGSLILGGVLDRHPELDVCVSHGGGAMPIVAGRFARACETRPWVPDFLREGRFHDYLRRIWFDSHVHGPEASAALRAVVGTDRLVFGTNFAGWDSGAVEPLPEDVDVLTSNARRLLRLTG